MYNVYIYNYIQFRKSKSIYYTMLLQNKIIVENKNNLYIYECRLTMNVLLLNKWCNKWNRKTCMKRINYIIPHCTLYF